MNGRTEPARSRVPAMSPRLVFVPGLHDANGMPRPAILAAVQGGAMMVRAFPTIPEALAAKDALERQGGVW